MNRKRIMMYGVGMAERERRESGGGGSGGGSESVNGVESLVL